MDLVCKFPSSLSLHSVECHLPSGDLASEYTADGLVATEWKSNCLWMEMELHNECLDRTGSLDCT